MKRSLQRIASWLRPQGSLGLSLPEEEGSELVIRGDGPESQRSRYERLRRQILSGTARDEEVRRELERAELLRIIAAMPGSTPLLRRVAAALRRPRNYFFVGLPVAVVIGLGVFSALRAGEVGVQIEATAATVSFVAEDEVTLTPYTWVRDLRIEGVGAIDAPGPTPGSPSPPAAAAGAAMVDVETDEPVRLDTVLIPRGCRVTISLEDGFVIAITPERPGAAFPGASAAVTWRQPTGSTLRIESPLRTPPEELLEPDDGTGARTARVAAHVAPGSGLVLRFARDAALAPDTGSHGEEAAAWELDSLFGTGASGLRFVVEERRPSGAIRPVSSLSGAVVSYPSLRREAERAAPYEHLTAEESDGVVLSLAVAREGIRLAWQGTVGGLRAGHPQHARSLMPRRMEKLVGSKQGAYVTNGAAYLALITMALLRRPASPGMARLIGGGLSAGGDS